MHPDPDPLDDTSAGSPDEQAAASDAEFAFAQGNLGNWYRTQGRYDEAIAAYRRALSVPDSAGTPASAHTLAYCGLGNVYGALGLYDEAASAFQQAIALDDDFAYAYSGLGQAYRALEHYEAALEVYWQAIFLDPDALYTYIGLGGTYFDLKWYEEAILVYQEALRGPDIPGEHTTAHTLACNGLGNAYSYMGRYGEAIAAFQQAIDLDPDFVHAHCSLASIHRRLGDEVAFQREAALALPMMVRDITYNRACYASISGDVDGALALLEAAIAERPALRGQAQDNAHFDFIRDDPRFQALVAG